MVEARFEPAGVIAELGRHGVTACVWKGSAHLAESLEGHGDLDVLVAKRDLAVAEDVLRACGYLLAPRAHEADQPGLRDWFTFSRGRLVQVQVYTDLVVGDIVRGWWHLPRETQVLRSRRASPEGPLVPAPEVDALLLLVRAAMSSRRRDRLIWFPWNRSLTRWAKDWTVISSRASKPAITALTQDWFGQEAAAVTARIGETPTIRDLTLLRSELAGRWLAPTGDSTAVRLLRALSLAARRTGRRHGRATTAVKRPLPRAGLWVVVTGAGAHAMADEICASFSGKFDTHRLSLRSSQPTALRRRRIQRARRARERGLLVVCVGDDTEARVPGTADIVLDDASSAESTTRHPAVDVWNAISAAR
jgi:hypothetical protein